MLAALAAGGFGMFVTGWRQSEPPVPPLVAERPHSPLAHSLDATGHLSAQVVGIDLTYGLSAVVLTYPEATILEHVPNTSDAATAYETDMPLDTLPTDTPLVCCLYDGQSTVPVSEWQYLGETAPFRVVDGGVQRAYHGTERASTHKDWPVIESLGRAPYGGGEFERDTLGGRYRLHFDPLGDALVDGLFPRRAPVTMDIGKTAYARAQQGVVRNPGTEFDQAREAPVVRQLLATLIARDSEDGESLSRRHLFGAAVGFVQSLPYAGDYESTGVAEYAKTPIETLVEGCGDCEDKAILLGALLSQPEIGCDSILVFPPGHAALGVKTGDLPEGIPIDGATIQHDGVEYCYLETTTPAPIGIFSDDGPEFAKSELLALYDGSWTPLNLRLVDDGFRDAAVEWID